MINKVLKQLFTRDLNRLKKEIESYKNEESLWQVENPIKNSGGNLCMHLTGNLKTFIGNGLDQIGYERQRDFEFNGTVTREKLLKQIDEAIIIVENALDKISDQQLTSEIFPMKIWKDPKGMAFTIIHLHSHLNYHLGQISYHRRLMDTENMK